MTRVQFAPGCRVEAHFERMWWTAQPMIEFGQAIDALELQ